MVCSARPVRVVLFLSLSVLSGASRTGWTFRPLASFVTPLPPPHRRSAPAAGDVTPLRGKADASSDERDERIASSLTLLRKAAETKAEDPDLVYESLEALEKLMRQKCKSEPNAAKEVLKNLDGSWRLVFTTGTKESQEKLKARVNYFPLKAIQSFDTHASPMKIENGIYAFGDFALVKFFGDFTFDLKKRKLEFDFDEIAVFGLRVPLKKGEAAKIGASSGLGSESNVANAQKDKSAFFNWISADESIATARGGGGGLALWKRVAIEEGGEGTD